MDVCTPLQMRVGPSWSRGPSCPYQEPYRPRCLRLPTTPCVLLLLMLRLASDTRPLRGISGLCGRAAGLSRRPHWLSTRVSLMAVFGVWVRHANAYSTIRAERARNNAPNSCCSSSGRCPSSSNNSSRSMRSARPADDDGASAAAGSGQGLVYAHDVARLYDDEGFAGRRLQRDAPGQSPPTRLAYPTP